MVVGDAATPGWQSYHVCSSAHFLLKQIRTWMHYYNHCLEAVSTYIADCLCINYQQMKAFYISCSL